MVRSISVCVHAFESVCMTVCVCVRVQLFIFVCVYFSLRFRVEVGLEGPGPVGGSSATDFRC